MKKIIITYKMIKDGGKKTAETHVDLPISDERYAKLCKGVKEGGAEFEEIRNALQILTRLQNYDEVGAWSLALVIEV